MKSTWLCPVDLRFGGAAPAFVGRLGLVLHDLLVLARRPPDRRPRASPARPSGTAGRSTPCRACRSGPIGVSFCSIDRAFVEAVGGAEDREAGAWSRRAMIGQLIEDGPRYFGSSDGWYWIVPCLGMLHELLRRELQHVGHDADVGVEVLHRRRAPPGSRSDGNWKTFSPFSSAATVMGSAFAPSFSGAHEHAGDRVAAREKCFEHRLAEVLLTDDGDSHQRGLCLRRRGERAGGLQRADLGVVVPEHLLQHLVGVLAQRRAALDLRRRRRELDRHADVEPLAALRMIELDPHVAAAHVLVVGEVLGAT